MFLGKKSCQSALCLAALLSLFAAGATTTRAQKLEARISVTSAAPGRVHVEGSRTDATTVWSFLNAYAGAANLAGRIENLALADGVGAEVPVRQLAPGEYEAERAANSFRYDLKLDPPEFLSDAAHISWLTIERGLIMPGDLLPLHQGGATISLELPAGWTTASTETKDRNGKYEVADASQTVFFVGQNLRERRGRVGSMEVSFAAGGEWAFSDQDFTHVINGILEEYEKLLGGMPRSRSLVILTPFPRPAAGNNWSAETRGGTIVLLSGLTPSKVAALAQLHNTLAHELLHLWIPNGLTLAGEYGWFYEGFTLYQALRTGMRQGHLSFQDYLNALGRAFDGYKSARGTDQLSLVELSRRRWTGPPALVYNKGMLVAFLYDLTLMQQTGRKKSLDDAYRELFRRYGGKETREDATRAVLEILNSISGTEIFTKRYIENPVAIDLAAALLPFGLEVESVGSRTQVAVTSSPSRGQRDLLSKLGYNEQSNAATRKLHESLKKRQQK